MPKKGDKQYIIYDGRYHTEPDDATVMTMCNTLKEAQNDKSDYGTDCVIVECEVQADGKTLIETGKTW